MIIGVGSRLVMVDLEQFYLNRIPNIDGVMLYDMLRQSDEELEQCHDVIQWMFPLPEPSQYNPTAPLITEEESKIFRANREITTNAMKSFDRMMRFYGLIRQSYGGTYKTKEDEEGISTGRVWFDGERLDRIVPFDKVHVWWTTERNHNWLRITRILRSMRMISEGGFSFALYDYLTKMQKRGETNFSDVTLDYWEDAVWGDITFSPEGDD